ncbi:hypothetical protein ACQ4PT_070329 [Festuca glaucescens]
MWKGFIGKLSGKAPKSGGGGGWASPLSKSPTSYGANGGQWDPMRSSPPLPVVAGAEGDTREDVFLRKVTVCCVLFDFSTDRGRDSPERERKRQVLVSLVDCIGAAKEPLTEAMVSACVRMFAINLFRVFPPKVVYELLHRFVMSLVVDVKVARKYVDNSFISRLLDLLDSDDPRERDCLKTVLHRIYGKFMGNRPFIRKAVSNILYRIANLNVTQKALLDAFDIVHLTN